MKSLVSSLSIVVAASLTFGAIAAVSAASAQVYTKGGYVENPQRTTSASAVTTSAGSVSRTYVAPTYTPSTIIRSSAVVPTTTFQPQVPSAAAVALGPVVGQQQTMSHSMTANTVSTAGGACVGGRQAQAFVSPTISFRGVTYNYAPTPPLGFNGGAAVAAIYPTMNGQSEICYSGACINGAAGSCSAIAVAQPGGRARIYVR